jgi:hypothetical protein
MIFYGFVRATPNNGVLQPRHGHILWFVFISFDCKNKTIFLIFYFNCIELNFYVHAVKDTPKPTTHEAEVSNISKVNSSCSVTTFMRKFTSIRGMGKHFVRNL